jgi:hypothetical protein
MRTDKPRLLWRLIAVLLAFSLIVAACGSDDDDAATDTADTTDAPAADTTDAPAADTTDAPAADTTDAPADEPADEVSDDPLVVAAMSAAGDPVELDQDVTVGYLQWVYADEAGKRIEDAAEAAVNFMGWEYITCDAGGLTDEMPVCGNQLLDQDIDVLLTDGIPEAFITDVLEQAEAAGIPALSAGGEVDPRVLYDAAYASDDTDMGFQVGEELKRQLPDGGNVIVQTAPAAWAVKRTTGLEAALEGTDIEIIDTWEVDFTDMVGSTEAEVATKIQQFDVDGIVIMFSLASIGAANAIGADFPDGGGPVLLTYYANPTGINDIRAGKLTGAVDEKLEWQSWAQVDAVAQLIARDIAPSTERAPDFGGLNFSVRQMVTADNIPATGTDVAAPPPGDYAEFFRTKWCAEFTNLPSC